MKVILLCGVLVFALFAYVIDSTLDQAVRVQGEANALAQRYLPSRDSHQSQTAQ